ncbi:unnamed protein product [Calicophoron daubneyi]|uniref:Uncharacterized protein n=1 Tax=Calicophoron daubneyi TaxID=300641 RepID=A0AAV2TQ27_CALDB
MGRVVTVKDLRTQFMEQAKCLDLKLDIDCTVLAELQDFYRRRAVVEQDYADALAKLANTLKQRHINETSKRPHWTPYTTTTIWNTLLGSTLRVSEAHSTLSELFSKQMVQRLADMDEDAVRLHKQCREMMSACQDRVLADTAKLQADQREYANRQASTLEADRARRRAEDKLLAAGQKARGKGKDPTESQRCQRAQNEYSSKQLAYMSTTIATARARNEYLTQLAATNHSVARYFSEEAPDIIDCLACGFHNSLARSTMMHLSCEEALKTCHSSIVEMLNRNITALDWRQDKACFLKRNEHGFTKPGCFVFIPSKEDNESHIRADGVLHEDLESNARQIASEIETLRLSTEETWKTLEEVEKKLLELINQKDYDVSSLFLTERPRRRRSLGTGTASNLNGSSALGSSVGSLGTASSSSIPLSASAPSAAQNIHCGNARSGSPCLIPTSTVANSSPSSGAISSEPAVGGRPQPQQVVNSSNNTSSNSILNDDTSNTGLYSGLRATYRDARIEQEKFYLERFAFYTQEMHQFYVLQVKLAEIRRALSTCPSTPPSVPQQSPLTVPLNTVRCGIPVLPAVNVSGLKSRTHHSSEPNRSDELSMSPPPPPPAPLHRFGVPFPGMVNKAPPMSIPHGSSAPPTTYGNGSGSPTSDAPIVQKPQTRRVLRVPNVGKPKLFGGTIDEYVEATHQAIPCILLSCTRVIVQYGMQQQGIFRVSGSQTEITEFKAAFERGEDPLIDVHEARDINSTAGLLKLYFRELGEPPFPSSIFLSLIDCARDRLDVDETARRLRQVVIQGLSRPVFIVMRYLFAFLSHVSEHADENMMDAYNLAICFGPTLMPVPSELNQVHYQASVIDLIKTFITHHAMIFDPLVPGPVYVKHTVQSQGRSILSDSSRLSTSMSSSAESPKPHRKEEIQLTCMHRMASEVAETAVRRHLSARTQKISDARDSDASLATKSSSVGDLLETDHSTGHGSSVDGDVIPGREGDYSGDEIQSISDSESSEAPYTLAVAQADFIGSTPRELSFQQGEDIYLYRRLNDHWWEGQMANDSTGTRGLVPHLYVLPKAALTCLANSSEDYKFEQTQSEDMLDAITESSTEAGPTRPLALRSSINSGMPNKAVSEQDLKSAEEHLNQPSGLGSSTKTNLSTSTGVLTRVNDKNVSSGDMKTNGNTATATKENSNTDSSNSAEGTLGRNQCISKSLEDRDPTSLGFKLENSPHSSSTPVRPHSTCNISKVPSSDSHSDKRQVSSSPESPSSDNKDIPPLSQTDNVDLTEDATDNSTGGAKPPAESDKPNEDNLRQQTNTSSPSAPSSRITSLRHTISYPVSSSLGSVPEDEALNTSITSPSSPLHRQISTGTGGDSEPQPRVLYNSDIDNALAEVMRGLTSLEQADSRDSDFRTIERTRELTRKLRLPCAKHTPDLVMDLPATHDLPSGSSASSPGGQQPDSSKSSADNFAEQGLDTMRKRPDSGVLCTERPKAGTEQHSVVTVETTTIKPVLARPTAAEPASITTSVTPEPMEKQTRTSPVRSPSPPGSEGEPKKLSIAARVAAFESNKSQPTDSPFTRSIPRPPVAPKPRR